MKIIGVACSPRKGKTTKYVLDYCMKTIMEKFPKMETEIIDLAEMKVGGCIACGHCAKTLECSQKDDFNKLIPILSNPEPVGMIVATPVYLSTMTTQCKAFLDRCVMFRRNGFLFKNVVGGAIALGGFRNGGQGSVIQQVHASMLAQDMVVVSDGAPTAHFGGTVWSGHPDGVEGDEFGLQTVRNLGCRVAELALRLAS